MPLSSTEGSYPPSETCMYRSTWQMPFTWQGGSLDSCTERILAREVKGWLWKQMGLQQPGESPNWRR
jgi:hypothetical protein